MDAMLKQYHDLKKKHPDAILLFRCGDFYECYEDDAVDCARILGITLTKRTDDSTRMAGFPHHALDTYLPKLIRAGRRVAICDFEDPNLRSTVRRGENYKINQNIKQKSVMETKNLKAADLIGKTIIVGDNIATIDIKRADSDGKLHGEFKKGDAAPMAMPLTLKQLKDMLDAGIWKIAGETKSEEPKAEKPKSEEPKTEKPKAEKPKTEKPKAEKPKATKPKAKKTDAPKSEEPKEEPKSETPKAETKKYVYETYVNKKGKTCARIKGLSPDEPAYTSAIDLHASASYETKKGKKSYYIIFGPRYKDAAREVCDALNAGKSFEVCKAIVDKTTEERKGKSSATTGYSAAEVAAMLKRVMAGEDIPEDIKKEMAA